MRLIKMSYTSVQLTEIKRVKASILESIKREPELKFPCCGVRPSGETPESSQCGKVELKMMQLCQPCYETYQSTVRENAEALPLMATDDVEQGWEVEQKQSVLSRLFTWVSRHKVLTALAVLGGVGLVAGAATAGGILSHEASTNAHFKGTNSNISFGNVNYGGATTSKAPVPAPMPNPTAGQPDGDKLTKQPDEAKPTAGQPDADKLTKQPDEAKPTAKKTTARPAATVRPAQNLMRKYPCTNFGSLQFYVPANTDFSLMESNRVIAGFKAGENARIDLDMTDLCPEGEDYIGRFSADCGEQRIDLLPQYFADQRSLNTRMSKTACNPSLETSLIFSGSKTQSLTLDKNKMCDEGVIQGFNFVGGSSVLIFAIDNNSWTALNGEFTPGDGFCVYDITVPPNICKELFNSRISIECDFNGEFGTQDFYVRNLSKGKANTIDLQWKSKEAKRENLPRKACTLAYDVMNQCVTQV